MGAVEGHPFADSDMDELKGVLLICMLVSCYGQSIDMFSGVQTPAEVSDYDYESGDVERDARNALPIADAEADPGNCETTFEEKCEPYEEPECNTVQAAPSKPAETRRMFSVRKFTMKFVLNGMKLSATLFTSRTVLKLSTRNVRQFTKMFVWR